MSKTHYRFFIKVQEGKMRHYVRLGWIAILVAVVFIWAGVGTSFSKTAKTRPESQDFSNCQEFTLLTERPEE